MATIRHTQMNLRSNGSEILANPDRSVKSVSVEAGIPSSTLGNWKDKYCQKRTYCVKNETNKLKSEDKFNVVILTASMSEAEISEYCRKTVYTLRRLNSGSKTVLPGVEINQVLLR